MFGSAVLPNRICLRRLPHEGNQRLRPFLVIRVFGRKLLRHELVFCAHPPEKKRTEDDEKKDESTATDNRRTQARDKASGIHRMPYVAVRTRCYQFLPIFHGDSLAPVPAKMLPRPDEEGHACGAQKDTDTTYNRVYGGEVEELGRYGSKNAAIIANRRPKLCAKWPWVSCFTPIAATIKYAMRMSQKASISQIKSAGFMLLLLFF